LSGNGGEVTVAVSFDLEQPIAKTSNPRRKNRVNADFHRRQFSHEILPSSFGHGEGTEAQSQNCADGIE
jgi:hypothetical protein